MEILINKHGYTGAQLDHVFGALYIGEVLNLVEILLLREIINGEMVERLDDAAETAVVNSGSYQKSF